MLCKSYDQTTKLNVGKLSDGCEYDIIDYNHTDTQDYYTLIKYNHVYNTNMRIKAFVTSFARNNIANVAMLDLQNVIRIQTDNVVFKSKIKLDGLVPNLKIDDKHTGHMCYENVNTFHKC